MTEADKQREERRAQLVSLLLDAGYDVPEDWL